LEYRRTDDGVVSEIVDQSEKSDLSRWNYEIGTAEEYSLRSTSKEKGRGREANRIQE